MEVSSVTQELLETLEILCSRRSTAPWRSSKRQDIGCTRSKPTDRAYIPPTFLATIVAILLFFIRIRIPEVLLDSMNYIADMNTPLAMMVAGFSVAQANIGRMCRNLRLYYVAAIKLIILPLCCIPILLLLPLSSEVAMTTLIAAACPSATAGIMMAIRYNQNYTYASEAFSLSTLLSVLTLPLVVLIAEQVL